MNNTTLNNRGVRRAVTAAGLSLGLVFAASEAAPSTSTGVSTLSTRPAADTLSARQQAIPLITAFAAASDMPGLHAALNQGLDAGLTVNEAKEILVQLYAYAGFPKSLNALGELLKVTNERTARGIQDDVGREPSGTLPTGDALTAIGEANQTRISGRRVQGPLFDFAPVINEYLQAHLFGAIFERDNLDWQSRELATVGALAAMPGVEAQLRSHMAASMRVGLTASQLRQLARVLVDGGEAQAGQRASEALAQALAASGGGALAANPKNGPSSLVYAGAITSNEAGQVGIHSVTYPLNGLDIAANVYTPAHYDPTQAYPAIVVAHPNGGVKEQVAGLYAQRLAEQGYVAIAMDAAYQGGSGGLPRSTDKPAYRIEDIHGAADFITQYAGVDADRLGLLGICGGGGYALGAAKVDKRFKTIATLSMFNSGRVRRNGFQDSQLDTVQDRLQQASAARAREVAGADVVYAGDADMTDDQIAALPFDLYREGYVYYWRTHAHPNSTFRYTTSSLLDLMRWDATDQIDLIDQPLLMMAGSRADTGYMTEDAFAKASGTQDKELFTIDGASHIETYWVPQYVDAAMAKLTSFYGRTL